jgi:hypothetical protein
VGWLGFLDALTVSTSSDTGRIVNGPLTPLARLAVTGSKWGFERDVVHFHDFVLLNVS